MLIAERFLENLMNPYLYEVLTIHAQLKDYNFVLKEIIPKQLGYKALKDQTSSHTLTHSLKKVSYLKYIVLRFMNMKQRHRNILTKVHYLKPWRIHKIILI